MKYLSSFLYLLGLCTIIKAQPTVELNIFSEGLDEPISMAAYDDSTFYVVQRRGTIITLEDGIVSGTFLDISHMVSTDGEGGLLDMAFHPDFTENKTFYINYTARDNEEVLHTYVAQLTAPQGNSSASTDSMKILMDIVQPFSNHNGGQILFGPDSNLYIFTGDGGSGGDPQNNAQDLSSPLGKILRIHTDPHMSEPPYYTIPDSNPFVGQENRLPEIWAYGLRNPWRSSFDRVTDSLWIADVGQGLWEEISVQSLSKSGQNYGWSCLEGNAEFKTCENTSPLHAPVYVYAHDNKAVCEDTDFCGRSVTGGYVYRGDDHPTLTGHYIFADYVTNRIWTLDTETYEVTYQNSETNPDISRIASFFEAPDGEIYIISLNGIIYRVTAKIVMTSLSDNSYKGLSIYPNPVTNELKLDVTEFDKAQIYTLEGKLVKTYGTAEESLDITALPAGTYIIKISQKGQKYIGKFIKL